MSSDNIIANALQNAGIHKEKGNQYLSQLLQDESLFLQQSPLVSLALREYHQANLYLRSIDVSESTKEGIDDLVTGFIELRQKKTEDDLKNIKELKVAVWNNMSLIYLKSRQVEKAYKLCLDIVRIDPYNYKGLLKLYKTGLLVNDIENSRSALGKLREKKLISEEEVNKFEKEIFNKENENQKSLKNNLKGFKI